MFTIISPVAHLVHMGPTYTGDVGEVECFWRADLAEPIPLQAGLNFLLLWLLTKAIGPRCHTISPYLKGEVMNLCLP